jgi:hypothetical protein
MAIHSVFSAYTSRSVFFPVTTKVYVFFFVLYIHIYIHIYIYIYKGEGKAIPLQAWTGPEGSRRLRFPDFKTVGT